MPSISNAAFEIGDRILAAAASCAVDYGVDRVTLAENVRAAQCDGSVRPGDPRQLAAMVLLITQSTIQSAEIVRPVLEAEALTVELAYSLNGYLS
jgi:hypothetical protein